MTMAEDVSPERGWEGRRPTSGDKALMGSLGVMVVDISEYVRFLPDTEVVCIGPQGPSSIEFPIPCIERVMVIRDFSELFKRVP